MWLRAKGLPRPWAPQEIKAQRQKGLSPDYDSEREAAPEWACNLLSQELWALNSRGRRRQCALP